MADDARQSGKGSVSVNIDSTPILYTDNIHMTTNADGVVMDVMQRIGNSTNVRVVTRIGMSRQHAKKFVDKLSRLLGLTEGNSQSADKQNN